MFDNIDNVAEVAKTGSIELCEGLGAGDKGAVNPGLWKATEEKVSSTASISSMGDLKSKAPELHKLIMDFWGIQMWRQSRRHHMRIKEIYRAGRRR